MKLLPPLIVLTFVLLVCAGLWVARKYGAVPAYIGFSWVIPLASFIWLKWGEDELVFGTSALNIPFVTAILGISSLLFLICLPLLIGINRGHLSSLTTVGLIIGGLLHGFPFLLYISIYLSVLIYGK